MLLSSSLTLAHENFVNLDIYLKPNSLIYSNFQISAIWNANVIASYS